MPANRDWPPGPEVASVGVGSARPRARGIPRLQSWEDVKPFDIASLHDVPAYPLPETALKSLPAHVRAELEQDGSVQIFASYDRSSRRFVDVVMAWEDQDVLERLAELVASDLSLHEAVDWLTIEEVERYTIEQWAAIRGVTVDAVRSNIGAAREKLLSDGTEDPETDS